jgi:hypothetical protein
LRREALRVDAQLRTGLRQEQTLADLLEQRQTDLILELFDLHGYRRLCEVQLVRGARDRAEARHGLEDAQLAQGDVHVHVHVLL